MYEGPRKHLTSEENARRIEKEAEKQGRPVGQLIRPANSWRPRRRGVVSALELAGIQTDGDEIMPSHDLDELESGLNRGVVLKSNEPHSLIIPSDTIYGIPNDGL